MSTPTAGVPMSMDAVCEKIAELRRLSADLRSSAAAAREDGATVAVANYREWLTKKFADANRDLGQAETTLYRGGLILLHGEPKVAAAWLWGMYIHLLGAVTVARMAEQALLELDGKAPPAG